MVECDLCSCGVGVTGVILFDVRFVTTVDYIKTGPERYLCANCTIEKLQGLIDASDDELQVVLRDRRELRLFVAEGLFGGKL